MRKRVFQLLALINRLILPRMSKRNLMRLTTVEKAIVAYRYWVTINALG
ncbi:MAG: hypothetical protein SH819_08530 [Cytophagales bacterium]|nr:hypothetical protein [Cytophagales bacterium]